MTEKFENKNLMAKAGYDVTDAEIVEEFKLSPELMGNDKINDAAFKQNEIDYTNTLVEQGYSMKEAQAKARADINKSKQAWRDNGYKI